METTNSSTSEWLGCSLQRDGMISTLPKLQTNLNQIGPVVKNCSNKGYFDLWTHNICQVWYWMIQEMASIDLNQWKFGLSYVINIHYIIVSLFIWYLTSLLAVSPRLCPRTFFGRWVDQCQWSTWFATVDSMLPKSCTTMSRNIDCRDPVSVSWFFLMTRKPCRISFKCRNVYNELK